MTKPDSVRCPKLLLAVVFVLGLSLPANSEDHKLPVNTTVFGVSIKGYDTVAYHTENRAVKGRSKYSTTWNDAKWAKLTP
jgi:hypothetical protein